MIDRPIVKKIEVQALDYERANGQLSILLPSCEMREDLNVPTESHLSQTTNKIKQVIDDGRKQCLITIQQWGEQEQVIACREGQNMEM